MIKLPRAVVERLVLACLYFRSREYGCYAVLEDALGVNMKGMKWAQRDVLTDIYNGNGLTREESTWEYLLDNMVEALGVRTADNVSHHPALIDTIVDILQQPHSRGALSGRTLASLRRAVLLPEEMTKFSESARKELHCTNCGKALIGNEMVTFAENGEGPGFFCTRCVRPTFVACSAGDGKCDSFSTLDRKMLDKSIGKPDCGKHTPSVPLENPFTVNVQAPPVPQAGMGDRLRGMARAAAAGRPDRLREVDE